jgi:hypothetical protein
MRPVVPIAAGPPSSSAHPEAQAIRAQLELLLANPHIRSSKRCQALLKHIVEHAASGSLDGLKERTLGAEVFQREPDYDTNQDSIVRTTAGEIRKRLAQYYLEPGHERELRISLPPGSYVPEFRAAAVVIPAVPLADIAPRTRPKRGWLWLLAGVLLLTAAALWVGPQLERDSLDRFWQPVLSDKAELVLCIGQPTRIYRFDGRRGNELNAEMIGSDSAPPASADVRQKTLLNLNELKPTGERNFVVGDVMAAIRVSEWLGRKNKPFRVLGEKTAEYRDLRGKPVVLIGFSNNRWTLGVMNQLRYYFDRHAGGRYEIRDRQAGGAVIAAADQVESPEEYAIVARVFDRSIEKDVFLIAGLADRGTSAAGEFLTNDAYIRQALNKAPADWPRKNFEAVLKSDLVGGLAGPPRVVAQWSW